MNFLEEMKAKNPYSHQFNLRLQHFTWEDGVQACWDAGWRPVPSNVEIADWLAGWEDTREMALRKPYILSALLDFCQWLLEAKEE